MKFNRDADFLKKRAAAYQTKKDNFGANPNGDFLFTNKVNNFKPRKGDNCIRLLPPIHEDAMFPWEEVYVHYGIGVNNSAYFCLAKMKNRPCPICEEAKKARDEEKSKEEIRALTPSPRCAAWIIDRKESDPSKNPLLWLMPHDKIAGEILAKSFKKSTNAIVYVDDPENGYDIYFTKNGEGIGTQYAGIDKDEPSPLHADKATADKWLEHTVTNDLRKIMTFKSYDYIKALLHGEDPLAVNTTESKEVISSESKSSATKVETAQGKTVESKPVGDDNKPTQSQLNMMSRDELLQVIASFKLEANPDDWDDTEQLAAVIGMELEVVE